MKVKDLIKELKKYNQDAEVCIRLDSDMVGDYLMGIFKQDIVEDGQKIVINTTLTKK